MITVIYNRREVVNELRCRVVRSTGSCTLVLFLSDSGFDLSGSKRAIGVIAQRVGISIKEAPIAI